MSRILTDINKSTFNFIHSHNTEYKKSKYKLHVYSHIGDRKHQEDRFTIAWPDYQSDPNTFLAGIFDGTVGDFASHNARDIFTRDYLANYMKLSNNKEVSALYKRVDDELLRRCQINQLDFTSTTCVSLFFQEDVIHIAHVGDSRAVLININNIEQDKWLTIDHKPNDTGEEERIISAGGSVEYLINHQNKPFIRGGDFIRRKTLGESPMQLQYSRAFGGKDLKPFGLSSVPDITSVQQTTRSVDTDLSENSSSELKSEYILIGSDGFFDLANTLTICRDSLLRQLSADNIAENMIKDILRKFRKTQIAFDNISLIVIEVKTL